MGMVIISIDQHKRPLTVRALVSVGRHQHVPLVILHIAGGREEAMLGVLRFLPIPAVATVLPICTLTRGNTVLTTGWKGSFIEGTASEPQNRQSKFP
jgi:hypothetical protein